MWKIGNTNLMYVRKEGQDSPVESIISCEINRENTFNIKELIP